MTRTEKLKEILGVEIRPEKGRNICVCPHIKNCELCDYLKADVLGYLHCDTTEWWNAEYKGDTDE